MTRFPLIFHEILSSDVSRLVSLLYTSLSITESSSHSIISGLWYSHSHQFPSWWFASLQSICFFSWLFFLAGGLLISCSIVYEPIHHLWSALPVRVCQCGLHVMLTSHALPRCKPSQFCWTFTHIPVSVWNCFTNSMFDVARLKVLMGLIWFFIDHSCCILSIIFIFIFLLTVSWFMRLAVANSGW